MKLSVTRCYGLAWKSFSKWWIPLCLVSGAIVVFQIIPQIAVRSDMDEFKVTMERVMTSASRGDLISLEEMMPDVQKEVFALSQKVSSVMAYAFPIAALLTVILLTYANWAAVNRHGKWQSPLRLIYIAIVHVVLAFVKLFAFFLFVIPGAYLYIKLLFVSLVMLEEKKGAFAAMKISWRMTEGNYWRLFLLIAINSAIQVLALPTVIGAIPATGYVNTARAAAFRMLRGDLDAEREDHEPASC